MKKILFLTIMVALTFSVVAELTLIKVETHEVLDIAALQQDLRGYDVIFFGEHHDDSQIHALQHKLVPGLLDEKRALILSFEMWERHSQGVLDDFLAGKIDEADFIKNSDAWPNHEDYLPLVTFAQKHGLKAIAANIPRHYAARVAREGWDYVDQLPPEERALIAARLTAPDDDYKKVFMSLMQGGSMHQMGAMNMEQFFQAQCIKDDTMAESIALALSENPEARVIHFNGDFHSRGFLGTVSRLRKTMPDLKIAVLTPQNLPPDEDFIMTQEHEGLGTHIILIPKTEEEESK